MFRIGIAAAGRDRASATADLVGEYVERARPLARQLGVDGPHLNIIEAPKALKGPERQAREAELLAEAAPAGHALILLDERGRNVTSRNLAAMIEQKRDSGQPGLAFLIGGADGFAPELRTDHPAVQGRISFGAATWPHLLCRAMLAEQIYRSLTILSGHPYHRD